MFWMYSAIHACRDDPSKLKGAAVVVGNLHGAVVVGGMKGVVVGGGVVGVGGIKGGWVGGGNEIKLLLFKLVFNEFVNCCVLNVFVWLKFEELWCELNWLKELKVLVLICFWEFNFLVALAELSDFWVLASVENVRGGSVSEASIPEIKLK